MSLYDHIAACNKHDLDKFREFTVAGTRVGWVEEEFAHKLERWTHLFHLEQGKVDLRGNVGGFDERSTAMTEVCAALVAQKAMPHSRNEFYAVARKFGDEAVMRLDRAWVPSFGTPAYGVHVNGYVETKRGPEIWVGVRAKDRDVAPGKFDNMVAGGLPYGVGLAENVVKEADEEAGVPEDLARQAVPVGAVSYTMEVEYGLRRDMLFIYDLKLPDDFRPHNRDGEISGFVRRPAEEVLRIVEETDEFKFNVNLVVIDFAIRHGILPPEHPDYVKLQRGLRSWG